MGVNTKIANNRYIHFVVRRDVTIGGCNFLAISYSLDLAENAEKYRVDPDAKPPFSYATIICLAMRANNNKVSLSNIYAWIRENFLFYKYADPAWQVRRTPSSGVPLFSTKK